MSWSLNSSNLSSFLIDQVSYSYVVILNELLSLILYISSFGLSTYKSMDGEMIYTISIWLVCWLTIVLILAIDNILVYLS